MTDQLRINEDGRIVSQPVTWDGEPLYSEDSVREGLFDRSAFEQMPGQIAMEEQEESAVDRFNAHWDQVGSPEAIERRRIERAEYEARYEAMMARKRAES